MWRTCFDCGRVVSTELIPRLIVVENENAWHFATEKEIKENIDTVIEDYFCKSCNEE